METLSYWIGMAGTVAFAGTAVLVLASKGIDLFGAMVLGMITAIGGGTVRDIILGVPVFWSIDLNYIWVSVAASIMVFSAHSLFSKKEIYTLMLYVDGLGAALFAIEGTDKVWDLGYGLPVAPVMLGILTGIGGGLIRDVLSGRETLLMSRELYATPIMLGSILYVFLLDIIPEYRFLSAVGCIFLIFTIRAAAIHWKLSVPDWLTLKVR